MSRSDLDRIQSQMKLAIQSHSLLVARMKTDPQNVTLQAQLHELQTNIKTLSDKQKLVVQQLKEGLVTKQQNESHKPPQNSVSQAINPNTTPSTTSTTTSTTTNHNNNEVAATKPKAAVSNDQSTKPSIPLTSSPKPLVAIAPKPTTTAAATQAPSAPLRVPQYHASRPSILSGGRQHGLRSSSTSLSPTTPSSHKPEAALPPSLSNSISSLKRSVLTDRNKDLSPEEREKIEYMACLNLITHDMLKELQSRRSERKRKSTANPQYAYGNYELEQRRRTPINFLNVSASKNKRPPPPPAAAASSSSQSSSKATQNKPAPSSSSSSSQPPQPRKRGRPPKRRRNTAAAPAPAPAPVSPADTTATAVPDIPPPPPTKQPCLETSPDTAPTPTPSCSSSSVSSPSPSSTVTGEDEERSLASEAAAAADIVQPHADIHEDFCAVCRRSGELLMCDTCSLVYHLNCCQPPLTAVPTGIWSCQKCTCGDGSQNGNWKGNLAVVHSYIQQKSRKEEERRREQVRRQELLQEQEQLQNKASQLQQAITQQLAQQTELSAAHQTVQGSVNQMKGIIRVFQKS